MKDWKDDLPGVINYLRKLGNGGLPEHPTFGLCYAIHNKFGLKDCNELVPCFETWDEFSGDVGYPVPDPEGVDPESRYNSYPYSHWEGEYGASRRRLCLHIANELEKEIEDEEKHEA